MIMATDKNGALGYENRLLFSSPQDMKWFKQQTDGMPIVMGRKTHESIGRVLAGRENIILTRTSPYAVEGAVVFNSYEQVLERALGGERIMVIGGGEIYELFEPYADVIYRTAIDAVADKADSHFIINDELWAKESASTPEVASHELSVEFETWRRK